MANNAAYSFDENPGTNYKNNDIKGSNTVKDADEWTTCREQMTGAHRSYLKTLPNEAGEEFYERLSKANASGRIGEYSIKKAEGLKNNFLLTGTIE